jgi:DNA topoisomerase-6 subunit B
VYRGNPFQIEVGLAYAPQGAGEDLGADEPVRLMRFANRVPLLYMGGGCAITKAVTGVNWKAYRLAQPKGSLPLGPVVLMVHMASVWVPFTSESKEAIAHYPEILKEIKEKGIISDELEGKMKNALDQFKGMFQPASQA